MTRRVEAPRSERASRNASEPDSASLRKVECGQAARDDEACHRRPSNERMRASGLPGWLGTARADRSVEEPGRPGVCEGDGLNAWREDITAMRRRRESEGLIVAEKRLIAVERRGLTVDMFLEKGGVPIG